MFFSHVAPAGEPAEVLDQLLDEEGGTKRFCIKFPGKGRGAWDVPVQLIEMFTVPAVPVTEILIGVEKTCWRSRGPVCVF